MWSALEATVLLFPETVQTDEVCNIIKNHSAEGKEIVKRHQRMKLYEKYKEYMKREKKRQERQFQ